LTPAEVAAGTTPRDVASLDAAIEESGGRALARYRDPLGARWLTLAALPLESVAPTPFQRDLSDAHVERLAAAIDAVGTFVDPIIAVPAEKHEGPVRFWTPNGYHRLNALKRLNARSVVALVSAEPRFAYRILALNTEKAHNVKERCLEAVRMAVSLADIDGTTPELTYAVELQEPHLVTLGFAYEEKARFAGGAYAPAIKPSETFTDSPIAQALRERRKRAQRLLAIDERVGVIAEELRSRGFDSPYLRSFVVARIRPFRPRGKDPLPIDALIEHMENASTRFDPSRVKERDVARAGGAPEE
jgi:ParB family chromosome partitioning protein